MILDSWLQVYKVSSDAYAKHVVPRQICSGVYKESRHEDYLRECAIQDLMSASVGDVPRPLPHIELQIQHLMERAVP